MIEERLFTPDIATLVTALQKAGQGHVPRSYSICTSCGGYLSTVMPSILAILVASYIQSTTKITPCH